MVFTRWLNWYRSKNRGRWAYDFCIYFKRFWFWITPHFEYGHNQDGYWCYDTMVLQFEDCVDVLRRLFGDQYEYIFYFDHSSGHDKLRPDGLNVNDMNKGFGGAQTKMRQTSIVNDSYLGPFNPILNVGDVQFMHFRENDDGPFWLTPVCNLRAVPIYKKYNN